MPHNMSILERPHLNNVSVMRDGIKILFSKIRSFSSLGDSCFPLSTEAIPSTQSHSPQLCWVDLDSFRCTRGILYSYM